jgi:hypothetical protein
MKERIMKRSIRSIAMIALGVLSFAVSAYGQITTATIYGNVTDPSGAAVAGAEVTATNELTGGAVSSTTNEVGEFTLTFLPVGRYTIAVKAAGFKEQKQTGLDLTGGQRVGRNIVLAVGEVTETVSVSAEAPLVNTVSAEQRENLTTTQVRELPLFRRDWTNILRVSNGIYTGVGNAVGSGVSLNGLAGAGVSLTVDGTDASASPESNSVTMAFGFNNTIKILSLEAIQEVNVTKGIAPAEIANTLSGNINLISKSGTNDFHGSVFENYQTGGLNARNQFLNRKPQQVFNQFGGSIGGPVIKNKLFFFGVYEGLRQSSFQALSAQVPTQEYRTRALAAVPAYKQWFDVVNLPNQPYPTGRCTATDLVGCVATFNGAGSSSARDNHIVVRGDYYLTSTNLVAVRWTQAEPSQDTPNSNSPANSRTFETTSKALTASLTHSRTRFSTETRFGYRNSDLGRVDALFNLNVPGLIVASPSFGMAGEVTFSRGSSYNFEQVASLTKGRHSIKFGVLYQRHDQTRENEELPEIRYENDADFIANIPGTTQITWGLSPYLLRQWGLGFFVQDDFKVNSRLVLNLGLRHDYFSVPTERDAKLFNRDEPFGFGPLRPADSIWDADRNNFGPRVGFAYTMDSGAKTVLRGGFGSFFTRPGFPNAIELVRDSLDLPFRRVFSRAEGIQFGLKYPSTNDSTRALRSAPGAPWTGTTVNPNFPTPYSLQWTTSLQRELTGSMAVETAYIATRGVKLTLNRNMNEPDRVTGVRPVPDGFSRFRHFDTSDSSYYHAWQSSLRKRFSRDFSFDAHYTWSRVVTHSIGDMSTLNGPQDNNNLSIEKGPAPFDIPHRFTADFLYELPFAKLSDSSSRGSKLLLGGWQIAGIYAAESGSPFFIAQGGSLLNQRIDHVGGNVYMEGGDRLDYLSRAAFARAPFNNTPNGQFQARPGTLGRNALRNAGFHNIDLAMSKNLAFTERIRLQIRVDMFNAFNHTSFGGGTDTNGVPAGLNINLDSSTFGRFTATRGARQLQFNARLTF